MAEPLRDVFGSRWDGLPRRSAGCPAHADLVRDAFARFLRDTGEGDPLEGALAFRDAIGGPRNLRAYARSLVGRALASRRVV